MVRTLAEALPNNTNLEEVRQTLARMKPALSIARVPQKTLDKFKVLAKEEFADDYGMTLKWLMDVCFPEQSELEGRIGVLESEVAILKVKLESNGHTEEPKEEKTFESPADALKRLKSEAIVNGH